MIEHIIYECEEKGLTIAFAESMTGGLLSAKFTEVPGASKVFKGSVVAYSNEIKINVLKIDEDLINQYHVVSKEVAEAMAKNVKELFNVSIGVGVTGDAGPTLQKNSEKRSAFYAICSEHGCKNVQIVFDKESRHEAQKNTVDQTYETLKEVIKSF